MNRPESIVTHGKLNAIKTLASHCLTLEGDFWECGVWRGGSAAAIKDVIGDTKNLYLFDSFEGLPDPCEHDNHHVKGDFKEVEFQDVSSYFSQFNNVKIVKGWIPETFKGFEDHMICFCHIDLDMYQSYKDTLNFVWPRLVKGGILVFDDYDQPTCLGAKKATDEFFENKEEKVIQGYYLIKN
jgi:O-methyltransferase